MSIEKFRIYVTYTDSSTELTGTPATLAVLVDAHSEAEAKQLAVVKFQNERPTATVLKVGDN
jgi:hypothetical protein